MSTLDINHIRDYLIKVGCKIEYPILVHAFKQHLYNPDPNVQGHVRTQFKDYVNRLATVSLENNMKFIILRPEFRPKDPQTVSDHSHELPARPQPQPQLQTQPQPKAQVQPQLHTQPAAPPVTKRSQSLQLPDLRSKELQMAPDHSLSMPPPPAPPPPVTKRSQTLQRPESLNLSIGTSGSLDTPPPRPPPRRRQSTASLFKSSPKPIEKSREIHDLAKKSPGRVKEHALKFNSVTSPNDLNALLPVRSSTMKENRLSREPTITSVASSFLQRNSSHLSSRPRSSHREDESDSSSLQPIDPLRRKWAIEACNCNYNGLLTLLREDPKVACYRDIVNGYTALHWAAKFGNLDIIKLIAGTHGVSTNIKSSAGYTPLHVAYIFDRCDAANLLLKSYKANPNIRDHSGKRPMQYWRQKLQQITSPNK